MKRRSAGPGRALGYAVVTLPALDLRAEPRHAAELGSQLLLGETVRVLGRSSDPGWVRVRNDADGYTGWVRGWGLVEATAARVQRWRERARAVIAAPLAQIRTGQGEGAAVSPAFFGGRVIAGPARAGFRAVELPDGRRGYLEAAAFAPRRKPTLEQRILTLLGTPYLWGGRTPAGYDCSAFVQQVLLEQGLALPRDAKDQCGRSKALRKGELPRVGDLVFFRRPGESASHVGLSVGGGYYAHCRGRVQIASLDADNPLCDKDLLPQSMGWFRPL
ncbi:MAG: C40 family peptidase [Candidatus Eisenbacteria bacterium]|nr:C40 family peptidase [Candidatus Eisenbacteria bacterium]